MFYGEVWAHRVVEAVLSAPAWPRTLLMYTYDRARRLLRPRAAPGGHPARLDPAAAHRRRCARGYDIYGPRVPAIVASPYAKPHAVTDVVHDDTSVLATIEAKWNLPALTYRDANAATVMDFLDASQPAFTTPPAIQCPSLTGPSRPTA